MNPTLVAVFLTLALSILPVPAGAQGACTTRCALVIGNSDYEREDGKLDLTNPKNDAQAMSALFEDLGFAVMGGAPVLDADQRQMQRAFQNFADFSSGAELAVVYYAGHGQSAVVSEGVGASFLIPTDAQLIDDDDLEIEAVSLDWAVRKLEDNVDALVLFLDACRDFNISARSDGKGDFRGIGAPKISHSTLISYAAQIGNLAADGDGVNSPYATALLNHLPTPGRSIRSVLGLVQDEVERVTNGDQSPDTTDQLGAREVYFAGRNLPPANQPPSLNLLIGQDTGWAIDGGPLSLAATADPDGDDLELLPSSGYPGVLTLANGILVYTPPEALAQAQDIELTLGVRDVQGAESALQTLSLRLLPAVSYADCLYDQRRAVVQKSVSLLEEVMRTCSGFEAIANTAEAELTLLIEAQVQREAKAAARAEAVARFEQETLPAFVLIPGGRFMMGSPPDEPGRRANEGPQRTMDIAGFYMSATEVSLGQFSAFLAATDHRLGSSCRVWDDGEWWLKPGVDWQSPGFVQTPDHPVTCVSYEDAQAYVAWVNANTDGGYALPSEAQWEYAARAGTTSAFHTGATLTTQAANFDSAAGATQPVGTYAANPWGLYDMHGNVEEWTQGCYLEDLGQHARDGAAFEVEDCEARALRGGSAWSLGTRQLRAAKRGGVISARSVGRGFRLINTRKAIDPGDEAAVFLAAEQAASEAEAHAAATLSHAVDSHVEVEAADVVTDADTAAAAPASATPAAVCETGYLTSGGECLAGYGPAAQHLQEVILGFGCPIGGADGKFGPKSVTSVRHLLGIEMAQYSQGLTAERFVEVEAGLGDLGAVSNCGCASDETYLSRQGRCQNEAARREAIARFERENLPAMVWIPGGSFTMGSPSDEPGRYSFEGPQRRIELSGFHMSATEITVRQFRAFVDATGHNMGSSCRIFNGSEWVWNEGSHWRSPGFTQEANHPVVCVSYEDAQAYLAWVNRNTNGGYRLPSEAQWEYAARAGTTTAYSTGGSISSSQANFNRNVGTTTPVGSYAPNAWGLYDMHGNVREWTQDCWVDNLSSHPSNGGANQSGDCSKRVLRGGSWINLPRILRSANRNWNSSSYRFINNGFRLLKTY